jgi:integrase
MLNCGFYQNDVAELSVREVDFEAGTITRPRSKTPDGPVVVYKLWPVTLDLLTTIGDRKSKVDGPRGPRILISNRDTPLVEDRFDEKKDGKFKHKDLVRDSVVALCEYLGCEKRPLKLLRKTSATLLADHRSYKNYVPVYLGHVPTTMADRHYAKYSQREFDEAIEWLRQQYAF